MSHGLSDSLRRLAISESGFVFDPASGQSFTVNETGLDLLRQLQSGGDKQAIIARLQQDYAVDVPDLERDIDDFQDELSEYLGLK